MRYLIGGALARADHNHCHATAFASPAVPLASCHFEYGKTTSYGTSVGARRQRRFGHYATGDDSADLESYTGDHVPLLAGSARDAAGLDCTFVTPGLLQASTSFRSAAPATSLSSRDLRHLAPKPAEAGESVSSTWPGPITISAPLPLHGSTSQDKEPDSGAKIPHVPMPHRPHMPHPAPCGDSHTPHSSWTEARLEGSHDKDRTGYLPVHGRQLTARTQPGRRRPGKHRDLRRDERS